MVKKPDKQTISEAPSIEKPALRSTEELLQELRAQQIELEMQNEALRQAQMALEKSRDYYVHLYEFAPVGYLTLTDKGLIAEINLTGAALLGVESDKPLQRCFSHFVIAEDRDRVYRHFRYVLQHGGKQRCEIALQRGDGETWHAQLDCLHVPYEAEAPSLRITLTDITEQVKLREKLERHKPPVKNPSNSVFVYY